MSCAVATTSPIDRIDREPALMDRLVEQSPTGPDADPWQRVVDLLATVSQTINLIKSGAYAHVSSESAVHANLCALLVTGAGFARQFDIVLYDGDVWPDEYYTRIGGDGALATGHDPEHLLSELLEAASWVSSWVRDRTVGADANTARAMTEPNWLATEPVTEFIARIWCLADRLDAREPVRALVTGYLSGLPANPSGSGVA
jgi:hypothetical protein